MMQFDHKVMFWNYGLRSIVNTNTCTTSTSQVKVY